MRCTDVIAYAVDCELVCADCASDADKRDGYPVFADSEADSPNHCPGCRELILEALTSDGIDYVAGRILDHFADPKNGSVDVLRAWAEAFDVRDAIADAVLASIEDPNAVKPNKRAPPRSGFVEPSPFALPKAPERCYACQSLDHAAEDCGRDD